MRSIITYPAAALVMAAMATATIGSADAQNQPPQDQSFGPVMGGDLLGGVLGYRGNYRGMGPWMMGQGRSGRAMCGAMTGHIEGRLAFIKAELKITDAQEPLWNAYAAAARDNAGTMLARCTAMMGQHGTSALTLPERLDQHEQLMAAQLDALRALNKTLKPLYAALSDGQKQSADQLFWGPMGMM